VLFRKLKTEEKYFILML